MILSWHSLSIGLEFKLKDLMKLPFVLKFVKIRTILVGEEKDIIQTLLKVIFNGLLDRERYLLYLVIITQTRFQNLKTQYLLNDLNQW